jgi:hypothetical protein
MKRESSDEEGGGGGGGCGEKQDHRKSINCWFAYHVTTPPSQNGPHRGSCREIAGREDHLISSQVSEGRDALSPPLCWYECLLVAA